MNVAVLPFNARRPSGMGLMLAWLTWICATPGSAGLAQGQSVDVAANRNVQAIPLQSANVDGQTSWIIEPEVPRIPKIAGLDPQLPPHIERRLSYAFDLAQRVRRTRPTPNSAACSDFVLWRWSAREGARHDARRSAKGWSRFKKQINLAAIRSTGVTRRTSGRLLSDIRRRCSPMRSSRSIRSRPFRRTTCLPSND